MHYPKPVPDTWSPESNLGLVGEEELWWRWQAASRAYDELMRQRASQPQAPAISCDRASSAPPAPGVMPPGKRGRAAMECGGAKRMRSASLASWSRGDYEWDPANPVGVELPADEWSN